MANPWQPGQLLFVGFHGTRVPAAVAEWIAAGRVGGVVLFARNFTGEPAQARELCAALLACAPAEIAPILAIDQEGGRVQRLRAPWTEWPAMRGLGERDDAELTARVAASIARELRELGITLDFAPVVDVDSNPQNPVIGDRSFGRTPALVERHAAAFVAAMQEAGVAACAKHFPGHGDTAHDSHLELPRLGHDLARLRRVELPPFDAAVEAGVASIMTAHVLLEKLDRRRPATFSPDIIALLREELAYDGVVFTDDLCMKAVADSFRVGSRIAAPLSAGVDALLVCDQPDLQAEALRVLERAPDRVVERALTRVLDLKRRFAAPRELPPASAPPYPEHQALARELTPRS